MEDDLTFDFSFNVDGQIWQLAIDDASRSIGIEVRDADKQEISFLLFDVATFEVSDYLTVIEVDWWTTLVALKNNLMFFDKYSDPQDPTKKSMLVFDCKRQALIKNVEDFQLTEISENTLIGTLASDKSVEKRFIIEEINWRIEDTQSETSTEYPSFFSEGSDTFMLAKSYLDQEIVLGIEYWEQGGYIIMSYYIRSGSKFDRKLLVVENEIEKIHLTLDTNLEGYASGAFMIISGYLIFITHSNQINGVKI